MYTALQLQFFMVKAINYSVIIPNKVQKSTIAQYDK